MEWTNMKTAGIIIFTIELLKTIYTGFTNVTEEKVLNLEEIEIIHDQQHTVNWQPYLGIGMVVIGGFLMLGRKKSLTT
jgi:hypothetical protein